MEEMNKLRRSICEKTNREYFPVGSFPKIDWALGAAKWLRRNGHPSLTNKLFQGLLSSITGKTISEEEATLVRILTSVAANVNDDSRYFNEFTTEEEKIYLEEMVKGEEIREDKRVVITRTILGCYVQVLPMVKDD